MSLKNDVVLLMGFEDGWIGSFILNRLVSSESGKGQGTELEGKELFKQ